MKYNKTLVAMILPTIILGGCASAPKVVIQPFDKSKTVEKSYDETWSSLIRFLSTNDIDIATLEKESGLIQLKGENLSTKLISEYCAIETSFMYSLDSGSGKGSITVVDEDGFVTVNTNIRFKFTEVSSMSNPPSYKTLNCSSTGKLETAILNSVI